MTPDIVWTDYVNYFFTSTRKEGMNAFALSILKSLQYVIVAFLAIVVQQIYDSASKGQFDLFNWQAWQSYLTPAFIFLLGFVNEILRKGLNPAVSTKFVQAPVVESSSPPQQPYQPNVAIRHVVEPPEQ